MTGPGAAPGHPLTLADYAQRAAARLEPAVRDFIDGGAGEERTLAANLAAFDRVRLHPRVLAGAADPDTGVRLLGRTWRVPFGVAPLAYHTLAHPDGEVATARACAATGVPLVVSTFAGRTLEDIADAATAPLWLQLYCFRDRATTRRLVERAEHAGYEALVLTVDAPLLGRRPRDLRNGFRLPPGITPANLPGDGFDAPAAHARHAFDPALDWSVLAWLRSISALPVLVKGVLTAADARRALDSGAHGIVVSNHGGRQLDGAPATLDVLPAIAAAVPATVPLLLDGGVRRGSDILAALALGADAVLLGRPVLHALAATGLHHAFTLLTEELREAMALTGTRTTADAGTALIRPAVDVPAGSGRTSARGSGPVPVADVPADVPADGLDGGGAEGGREGMPLTGRPTVANAATALLRRSVDGPGAARRPFPAEGWAPGTPADGLHLRDLHGSLADPLLDTMNFLNEITHRHPEAISFAPGRPYDGFFEVEQVFGHLRRYLDHLEEQGATPDQVRSALFQYGPAAGQIREVIADQLRRDEGIDVPAQSIVVTVGCQEAMLLAVRALISGPDDVLLVSSPCYVGITGAARLLDAEVRAVAEHPDGFRCADLTAALHAERARGRRPRAFYVIPDHANPSGTTLPPATRRELLELAAREDILLLEDSPYRLVSPGRQLPTLKALDRHRRVIHLGSFSKSLFPGARVGFAVADQRVTGPTGVTGLLADHLTKIKSMVTVNTSPLAQAVVAGMLLSADGGARELNGKTAAHYGDALRVTLHQLGQAFPPQRRAALGVRWNEPTGGFFLALTVPFPADNAALAHCAEEYGVIWTPMSYFYPDGGGANGLRLSVSYLTHAQIADGVGRLARFIEDRIAGTTRAEG
ncbi:aminotransferase class I/II-fold pyridoxal phosphate-dependent enzyme [Streptomyces sp. NPDC094437]|uniref:aminotransferase class I/II-fold pyridoxal phosphate-dependent enzyme n=1 Tax=Streptomyces sp. NPDC094437 TaxID=3366060 RepID=UPI00380AFB3D